MHKEHNVESMFGICAQHAGKVYVDNYLKQNRFMVK